MTKKENNKMDRLISKALSDETFKTALIEDPIGVLTVEGITVPKDFEVKIVENTNKLLHLVLPMSPCELSDNELDGISGGILMMPV